MHACRRRKIKELSGSGEGPRDNPLCLRGTSSEPPQKLSALFATQWSPVEESRLENTNRNQVLHLILSIQTEVLVELMGSTFVY